STTTATTSVLPTIARTRTMTSSLSATNEPALIAIIKFLYFFNLLLLLYLFYSIKQRGLDMSSKNASVADLKECLRNLTEHEGMRCYSLWEFFTSKIGIAEIGE